MSNSIKPKGIFFLAILYLIIAGILIILCFVLQPIWNVLSQSTLSIFGHLLGHNVQKYLGWIYGTNGTGFIVIFIICAIILVIDVIALLQLRPWSRLLAMIIAIPLLFILIGFIIIWYLMQSEVKQTFGENKEVLELRQHRGEEDDKRFEDVKKFLEENNEIPIEKLAKAMEISRNNLVQYIGVLSKELGIKIKGQNVLIAPSEVSKVLDRIEYDLKNWQR